MGSGVGGSPLHAFCPDVRNRQRSGLRVDRGQTASLAVSEASGGSAAVSGRGRPALPAPRGHAVDNMPTDVTQSDKSLLVKIDKLVHGGKGLAHDGSLAVFVEGVLPGESVRIQLERVKKGYAEGRLLEVVTPSPHRTDAPCPVYGQCGGCQLQHASPTAQLELKRSILTETLVRIGGLTDVDVPSLIASPEVYGYRHRARLAVVTPKGKTASLAYHEEGSHRLVPIAACPLLAPRLNEAIAHLNRALAGSGVLATVLPGVRVALAVTPRALMGPNQA